MKNLIIAAVLLFSVNGFSDEHKLTNLKGTNIDLKMADHAISGSIKDFVVFGYKSEEGFGAKLIMKRNGKIEEATFATVDGKLKGQVGGREITLQMYEKVSKTLLFQVGDMIVPVEIHSDQFVDNHFVNPMYKARIGGENVTFSIEDGQACVGFSALLSVMILGAYL